MAEAYENLAGRVEEIVYRNPDNGYTVLQLNTGEANGDGETVAGEMPPISEGEEAVFRGQWTMHPRFGRQFKAVQRAIGMEQLVVQIGEEKVRVEEGLAEFLLKLEAAYSRYGGWQNVGMSGQATVVVQ